MLEASGQINILPAVEKAVERQLSSFFIDCSCVSLVSSLEPQQAPLRAGGRASLLRKEGISGVVVFPVSLSFLSLSFLKKHERAVVKKDVLA
jgi:hypothetical protein